MKNEALVGRIGSQKIKVRRLQGRGVKHQFQALARVLGVTSHLKDDFGNEEVDTVDTGAKRIKVGLYL